MQVFEYLVFKVPTSQSDEYKKINLVFLEIQLSPFNLYQNFLRIKKFDKKR
jgi:hypothetical protein